MLPRWRSHLMMAHSLALLALLAGPPPGADPDAEARSAAAVEGFGGTVIRNEDLPGKPVVAVRLAGSRITDAGLKELAGLASLRDLDLSNTAISDAGVNDLAALKGLSTLNLAGTRMTSPGIQRLRNTLPNTNIAATPARPARKGRPPAWALVIAGMVFLGIVLALLLQNRKPNPVTDTNSLPSPVFPPVMEPTLPGSRQAPGRAQPLPGTEELVRPVNEQLAEQPFSVPVPPVTPLGRRRAAPAEPEPGLPPPRSRWSMEAQRAAGCVATLFLPVGVGAGIWLLSAGQRVAGGCLILAGPAVFLVYLQWAVHVAMREGAKGLPIPQPIDTPLHAEEVGIPTDSLAELQFGPGGLHELGFEPAGWFYVDTNAGYRVGAWRHPLRPDIAYILLQPGGSPRLRFIRRFAEGVMVVTSDKKSDLGSDRAATVYLQVRGTGTVAGLWAWHREAVALFPEEAHHEGHPEGTDPMGPFMESTRRICEAGLQARWWWLPGSGMAGEFQRMGCLDGMGVREQIESGWAEPIPRVRAGA